METSNLEQFIYRHLSALRRSVQFLALFFIFIIPFLNKQGINAIIGTYYSISIGQLDIVDPSIMLQSILLTKEVYFPLFLAGILPLIFTLFFGKAFCSWICPYNLLAEFGDKMRRKIYPKSIAKRNKNPKPHIYWFVFGSILIVLTISGIPLITLLSFPGLISGQAADAVFSAAIGIEILLVVFVLLLEVFIWPRFWCKYACPVGAMLAVVRSKHTLSIAYDPVVCANNCPVNSHGLSACNSACPLQLNPRQSGIYPYCYNCGACVDACQNEGGKSIKFTFHPQKEKQANKPDLTINNLNQARRNIYGSK